MNFYEIKEGKVEEFKGNSTITVSTMSLGSFTVHVAQCSECDYRMEYSFLLSANVRKEKGCPRCKTRASTK